MHCRDFRRLHGAWVADELPQRQQDLATMHVAQCDQCSRFDAFTRRALMVARSAEPLQVSADFSQKLAARLATERAALAADPAGLAAERAAVAGNPARLAALRIGASATSPRGTRPTMAPRYDRLDVPEHGLAWLGSVSMDWRTRTPLARAAAIFALVVGTSGALLATRDGSAGAAANVAQAGLARTGARPVASPATASGALVVLQRVHPVDGFIADAHDPLQPAGDDALAATAVSAAAPLWPTARMASSAAGRFAAMEFGDVRPVPVSLRR